VDSTWGGTIAVNGSLTVSGDFQLLSGSFGGDGAVAIAGSASQWQGAGINLGRGGFVNNGTLTIGGFGAGLGGPGTFTNNGTITLNIEDRFTVGGGASLRNTGTFNLESDAIVDPSGDVGFLNTGTVQKTGGTGTSTIQGTFNNDGGAINVQTGTLDLGGTGLLNGGSFAVTLGATLDLAGSATGTFTGSGGGTVAVVHGGLNGNGAVFNLPGKLFQWSSGGSLNGGYGGLIIAKTGTLNINTTLTNLELTGESGSGNLINLGTINEYGGGSLSLVRTAVLNNAAGATFNLLDNSSLLTNVSGGTIFNAGLLRKSRGAGTSTIAAALNNTGRLQVNNGTLNVTGNVPQVVGERLTAGSWAVFGSATLTISSTALLRVIGTSAQVSLSGVNSSFTNLAGLAAVLPGGSFSLLGGQSFATVDVLTNGGTIQLSPGSVLTVADGFFQTSLATLVVQLGGTPQHPRAGLIQSPMGAVTLAGKLKVTSTILPALNAPLVLVDNEGDAPVSGLFAGLGEGATFTVKVGATTATYKISYVGGNGQSVTITRTA
jgi:hypothetical protein